MASAGSSSPTMSSSSSPSLTPRSGLQPLRPSPMSRLRGRLGSGAGLNGTGRTEVGGEGGDGGKDNTDTASIMSSVSRLSVRSVGQGGLDEDKLRRYKTVMCQRQSGPEGCKYGVHCDFAHTADELRRSLSTVAYAPVLCAVKGCSDPLCKFAHNMAESQYHPDVYKTKLCSHFDKPSGCPRGNYCSFAHGKNELRHKNRKFADLSCKELIAPIMSLTPTTDTRNDATFAHFRQRARAQMPQPVRREAGINASYGFGDRERRYSAPDRILRERMAEEGNTGRRTSDDDIDERIKHRMMAILHDKELLRPSTSIDKVEQTSEQDRREDDKDAIDLLTADPDFLCTLSLPALQQLQLFQEHTLATTQSYIASYSASHPVDSCCQCGEQQADCMLFPCQHAVVCFDCSAHISACPWKGCGRRVEETATLLHELPDTLTRSDRQVR